MKTYISATALLVLSAVAQNNGLTPPCAPGITSISGCPTGGCGGISDSRLDVQKNRIDSPPSQPPVKSVADLKAIPQPTDWLTGQDRSSVQTPGRERSPVRLVAFVKLVNKEGAESCNCELTKEIDNDVHLVMVDRVQDPESASISAEFTPRLRALGHPNWTATDAENALQGKLVRLTGWLMLDTAHVHHSVRVQDASGHKEIARGPINRASNWEVHPITKVEVCNASEAACKAGQGWVEF
jgi:hypothetical protein